MSIQQFSSQTVGTQLEQVNPKLSYFLTEAESDFAKNFKKQSEKHRISAWNAGSNAVLAWRIPVLLSKGGDYQAISLDGGDLGTGSLMDTSYMTEGYFATDIAFNVPMLASMATKNKQQAITNVLQMSIQSAVEESALYNEIAMFQDGTGIIAQGSGTGSPAISGGLVTYNLETAAFSYIRVRGFNQLVDVYGSNNVSKAYNLRVNSINYSGNAITLNVEGASYSPLNTDQIFFPGMAGTTGVGSYTASSGSFRYGIYTFNTLTTTGSLLGLSYASAYELACNQVNCGAGFFTPSAIYAGKSQLTQRRDDKILDGMIGVCHTAQRTSWYTQGVTIANQYLRPGESAKNLDLAGQGTKLNNTFEAGDITHYVSRYANKSRVDWLNPKNFGWVMLDDEGFVSTPDGQRIFIGHSSSTGNPQAGFQFYMHCTRNLYSVDPGASVVFYNLQIPAGQ